MFTNTLTLFFYDLESESIQWSEASDVRALKQAGAGTVFRGEGAHRAAANMGKIFQVMVHGLRGEKMFIDLCNTEEQMQKMTVRQLKEKIAEKLPETAGKQPAAALCFVCISNV